MQDDPGHANDNFLRCTEAVFSYVPGRRAPRGNGQDSGTQTLQPDFGIEGAGGQETLDRPEFFHASPILY